MTAVPAVPAVAPVPAVLAVDLGPGVRAGFTVGAADVPGAAPPNLSLTVGDAVDATRQRAGLERWVGGPIAFIYQVHGAAVHVATGPTGDDRPRADAVVSAVGVPVAVLVADCVPVLLADAASGVVGAVHAGRRGVVADVVTAAVDAMVRIGARRDRLRAMIGPAICGACYEVPAELRAEVARGLPVAAATTSWGTPALDLPAAVEHQLRSAGVLDVRTAGGCTLEDPRWFSHRGTAVGRPVGRLAAVIRARPVGVAGRVLPGEDGARG